MIWLKPWGSVDDLGPTYRTHFEAELRRELSPGHPLYGCPVAAVGKRGDTDDVLFQLLDGSGRVASVHLTYGRRPESPPWPHCTVFASLEAWAAEEMEADHSG